MRTLSSDIVANATHNHHDGDFDSEAWIKNHQNIALINDAGDVNLFNYAGEGRYYGHFFYKSRGRDALRSAKEMLAEIFSYPEVETILGLTPVEHLGAKWLTRKLGFKSYGEIDTVPGRCELFILTRKEYEQWAS